MINGCLDVESSNMSAPLLAKTFGTTLFSIVSAIAFATILGTVSGLIVAASGAVAHVFMDNFLKIDITEHGKVKAGRIAAVVVGLVAILLGILFKNQNVNFLVGLAFAIAASANLPAILMLLFWKKTTSSGISWAIVGGESGPGARPMAPEWAIEHEMPWRTLAISRSAAAASRSSVADPPRAT